MSGFRLWKIMNGMVLIGAKAATGVLIRVGSL
jgi:hypothetical protein